jgi:hypothetical protein
MSRYAAGRSNARQIMPNHRISPAAQRAARENLGVARKAWIVRTDERAARLAPVIKALQAKGITSLKSIAGALNKRRVRTARSIGRWHPTQVARLLKRLGAA